MREFRCYAGVTVIEFSTDVRRNTTVVQGSNGAGKTSILQALNFALYGRSAVPTENSSLINAEMLKASRENAPARASVTLEFIDSDCRFELRRAVRGFPVGSKTQYLPESEEDLRLTFTGSDGNTKRDPFPTQTIERLLPSPIRTFFLFDGERIADFTKPGRERDERISKAVNDVLHIEALSRAAIQTAKIAAEKNRALEKAGAPAVKETALKIRLQEAELERRKTDVAKWAREIEELIGRIQEIDDVLGSVSEVAKLALERRRLEGNKKLKEERRDQLRMRLSSAIIASVPALARHQVSEASVILSKYKSRHEIPARIADYFLRDLIEERKCICGRPIAQNGKEEAELKRLLSTLIPNTLQDKATELASRLRPMSEGSDAGSAKVVELLRSIRELDSEFSRLDREIERLGGAIDEKALDKAAALNSERSTITQQLMQLKGQHERGKRHIFDATAEKHRLIRAQETELQKQRGLRELQRVWVLARECAEALQQARSVLEERLRASLSAEATTILRNLASAEKKYFFTEVRVDPNFVLRVIDDKGRDSRAQLSSGETQVSSLAFMLAMTRLGGQEAPLVIDTPLGRLDESVRASAAHWLPNLTRQLVLLATDSELSPEVQRQLEPRMGKKLRLIPGPEGTRVEELVNA